MMFYELNWYKIIGLTLSVMSGFAMCRIIVWIMGKEE